MLNANLTAQTTFISEIYYYSGDTNSEEAIEVAGITGSNLDGWQLALYDGSTGTIYDSYDFDSDDVFPFTTTLEDGNDYGVIVAYFGIDGIQNDSADGVALIDNEGNTIEFWSYGGSFTALDGPAIGNIATNIGATETLVNFNGSKSYARRCELPSCFCGPDDMPYIPIGKELGEHLIKCASDCNTISQFGLCPLLEPVSASELQLSSNQQKFYNNVANSFYTKNVQFVKVGHLPNIQQNGILRFTIPGYSQLVEAEGIRVEFTNDFNYTWSGKFRSPFINSSGPVISTSTQDGYMSIVTREGGSGGFFQLSDAFYELLPIKGNICILREHDLTKYSPGDETCGTQPSPLNPLEDFCIEEANNCPAVISVLVLITPEAQDYFANFSAFFAVIMFAVMEESVNIAFQQSGIPNKRIRVIYDHLSGFPYDNQDRIFVDALTLNGSNPNVPYTDAQNKRSQHSADLAVMISDYRYQAPGAPAGIHSNGIMAVGPDEINALGIIEAPVIIGPLWTFAHEIGHAFGARHSWVCDNTDVCGHGHTFGPGAFKQYATLHGFHAQNPDRILHFSNPDIEYEGFTTGVANPNTTRPTDNAKTIRNSGCLVADFFPTTELSCFISGIPNNCNVLPNSYTAEVISPSTGFPGQAPYTFEWRWNQDGIFTPQNPGLFLGSSPSITIGVLDCPFYFLQLKVRSSDNFTVTCTKRIFTGLCPDCIETIPLIGNNNIEANNQEYILENPNIIIFPNPAKENVNLKIQLPSTENKAEIEIVNINGKVVKNISFQNSEINTFQFYTNDLPRGLYLVTLKTSRYIISKKLILK